MRYRLKGRTTALAVLVLVLLLGVATAHGGSTAGMWSPQDSGVRYAVDSVFFIDSTTGWTVGGGGTVLKTTDGGETWSPRAIDTGEWVTDIHFVDESTGWAVADKGLIFKSTDGGDTWTKQTSPTTKNLWNVQFVDENNGWVVGIAGGYGPPPPGEYSPILKTTNGGTTWTEVEGYEYHVMNLFFIDENTGWIMGGGGLFKSVDGGDTWADKGPDFASGNELYWSAHFLDLNTGWVVGDHGLIIHTNDGGETWTKQDWGGTIELIDVFFVNAEKGWVVGNSGTILATSDGGTTWSRQFSAGSGYLASVHFADENTGWASGQGGAILAYRYPPPPVVPIEGDNRYLTAIDASKHAYPTGADTVVIATGRNWPDALGGTSLAGALEGPVLLVGTNVVPAAVAEEIERLGAAQAIILGGTAAVGEPVETELKTLLGDENVERIEGNDRYKTADKIALRVIEELGTEYDGTAFVATGGNFPDALAAAPLAAANYWPLYLVHPARGVLAGTQTAMADVTDVLILGGDAVVSGAVETYLEGKYGADKVDRLWGANRYATAVAVATYGVESAGLAWDRAGITTGENFPDALAGGATQGRAGSVMLLTRSNVLVTPTSDALSANKAAISTVTFFGGANAVTEDVRTAIAQVLQ